MCGIAGVVSAHSRDLGPLLKSMLEAQHHRGPDGAGIVVGRVCQRRGSIGRINFANQRGTAGLGHVRLAITGSSEGIQPFASADGKLHLLHNGEIYNFRELWRDLKGPAPLVTGSDSEVLCRLIEDVYSGDLVAAVEKVLPHLDGVYALAVTDGDMTVIARDRIGVRQLYTAELGDLVAFASEKKALRAVFGEQARIRRLLPGHMLIMRPGHTEPRRFWQPNRPAADPALASPRSAINRYARLIDEAVRKRVRGQPRVGVIYSGGVDSFLIAHLVQRTGVPFTCYTAGLSESASDVVWARRTAEEHGFPLHVSMLTVESIEAMLPEVMHTIEDHSLNQVEVALPVFASIRAAQEAGERVILNGQGADELFGGYPWYSSIVDREGYDEFVDRSWEDTFLLYKECLEREDKISMAHSLELRVPFLDPAVIDVAFAIAPELKVQRGGDAVRKRVHRAASIALGVPEDVAFRAKEAAQHGANVHDAFAEIARRHDMSPGVLEDTGYDPGRSVTEKLGSSSRYGFRYGDAGLWEPPAHVQCYLDGIAAGIGLLTGDARDNWAAVAASVGPAATQE
ncbi:MAG TPA: asparagine synthetase B [Candidatus Krumholzibacteria bacterium]|nr:asparagine synthetase B [Candidatus Krumholzibacteria bacterium]